MSPYIKFCRKEHNIVKGCKTIQIGTAHYYRDVENKEIRDEEEGIVTKAFVATKDEQFTNINTDILRIDGVATFAPGAGVTTVSSQQNVYIFCCSKIDSPSIAMAAMFKYDDYYEITDIKGFADQLANLLSLKHNNTPISYMAKVVIDICISNAIYLSNPKEVAQDAPKWNSKSA